MVGIVVGQQQGVEAAHAVCVQGGEGLHLRRARRAGIEQQMMGGRLKIRRQALSDIQHNHFQTAFRRRGGTV